VSDLPPETPIRFAPVSTAVLHASRLQVRVREEQLESTRCSVARLTRELEAAALQCVSTWPARCSPSPLHTELSLSLSLSLIRCVCVRSELTAARERSAALEVRADDAAYRPGDKPYWEMKGGAFHMSTTEMDLSSVDSDTATQKLRILGGGLVWIPGY
jgi:hypothetical protein